ncbi:MAG: hypothetical protein ACRDU5_14350 [Mycobacterium sp.]
MAGPYPPDYGAGAVGPPPYPVQPYPENPVVPSSYPGMLPPPMPYRKRRRWPIVAGTLLAMALVAAVVAALVLTVRSDDERGTSALTPATAQTAIQTYLDSLANGDDETIARHTLCGIFDSVKEKRSDLALADLSSDAFRKQFSGAEVTSIDKMVFWSQYQAQVLFTMRATPSSGTRGQAGESEEQGVAQLLVQDNEILVCSYLLRAAGQY